MTNILTEIISDFPLVKTFKGGEVIPFYVPVTISTAGTIVVCVGKKSIGWSVPLDAVAAVNEDETTPEEYLVDTLVAVKLIGEVINVTAGAEVVAVNDYVKVDASGNGTYIPITEAVNVYDLDAAASTGVAVYMHSTNGVDAWLEFVSPTNADGQGTLADGGSSYFIFDSDAAATDGLAIYFDEDATNVNERFLIVSPSGRDLKVKIDGETELTLKHDASAASNGVQVYFDEDGTNSYERLMFVSPTDADGTGKTGDDTVTSEASGIAITGAAAAGSFQIVRID